jgi:hypothetical protein
MMEAASDLMDIAEGPAMMRIEEVRAHVCC